MNTNIKEVSEQYQDLLTDVIVTNHYKMNKCCICGKHTPSNKTYYSTGDFIVDSNLITIEEFSEFTENEVGSGFGTVIVGSECIKKIII
jgi:hypothetical protein